MPEKITVKLDQGRSYDIVVGRDLLLEAGEHIAPVLPSKNAIIVTDKNIARHGSHLENLIVGLESEGIYCRDRVIKLDPGESTKSFDKLESLIERLLSKNPDRKTTLIALGGGVIGDITGFAASILLRGVPFIQVPTTLLAMVDSSVGGKTGINTSYGKNLVGSFYQPKLVLIDTETLGTLPPREYQAGYAEIVKYGLIDQPKFFEKLEKNTELIEWGMGLNRKKSYPLNKKVDDFYTLIEQCIRTSCRAKAVIVAKDEKEADVRALLNLGHTFGHALEAEMGYDGRLLHGEAVAAGMAMAFRFSADLGLCPQKAADRVSAHLKKVGLPFCPKCIGNFSAKKLLAHMKHDKKVQDGKLVLILVKGIGRAFIAKDVDEKTVRKFLEGETGKA